MENWKVSIALSDGGFVPENEYNNPYTIRVEMEKGNFYIKKWGDGIRVWTSWGQLVVSPKNENSAALDIISF